jgi:hypothetical protein
MMTLVFLCQTNFFALPVFDMQLAKHSPDSSLGQQPQDMKEREQPAISVVAVSYVLTKGG